MDDALTPPIRYAGFWRRKVAYGIDLTIITLLTLLFYALFGGSAFAQTVEDIEILKQMGWVPEHTDTATLLGVLQAQSGGDWVSPSVLLKRTISGIAIALIFSSVYNIYFVASVWQATPGKRWLGMKVVTKDGKPLTLLQSAYRHLMSGVSMGILSGLGYLTIPFSKEKAALHDMICNTRVVRL